MGILVRYFDTSTQKSGVQKGVAGSPNVTNTATIFYVWAGADATNAPSNVPMGSVGFDGDGASTGNVYVYDLDNDTWRDTTQSVAGFFGV